MSSNTEFYGHFSPSLDSEFSSLSYFKVYYYCIVFMELIIIGENVSQNNHPAIV